MKKFANIERIIKEKNTRLCFSADFTKTADLIEWIHLTGKYICILKTHIDMLEDFSGELIPQLNKLKKQYNFLILEDRKFSDIGKTFYNQLYRGLYKIASWADIITIHGLSSAGMLSYLTMVDKKEPKIVIVSQMSSKNNIIDNIYSDNCYKIAKEYPNLVVGFIAQTKFVKDDSFFFMTPGVRLISATERDQLYRTPSEAYESGSDIIIVGSGIYKSLDPIKAIKKYSNTL